MLKANCKIFFRSEKDFTNLINLVEVSNSSQQSEVGKEIGDINYTSVSFQICPPIAGKRKRDVQLGSSSAVVTFKRPGGYLRTQQGWRTVSTGKINLQIRTQKRNSLLLFSTSGWPKVEKKYALPRDGLIQPVNPVDRLTGTDVFCVELREGYLVFLLNTGSGINEFATENIWRGDHHKTNWFVADGVSHFVEIQLTNGSLTVTLDGNTLNMRPKAKPKYTVLNLNGGLYIGGLPEELRDETPPQAWSARLREDYVGQLGSLSIDGVMLDLSLETNARWAKGYIQSDDGEAIEALGVCSRSKNPCAPDVRVLTFDGYQGIGVRLSRLPKQSEAESLVLRLQTHQKDALLFESSSVSSTAPDRFGVEISNQQIVIFYNLGFETKRFTTAKIDSKGEWHTLKILRRSKRLLVSVDNATFNYDIKDDATILDSDYDCIGSLADDTSGYGTEPHYDAFIGRLSQFQLNGLDMLKIISELANYRALENPFSSYDPGMAALLDTWKENIEVTAVSTGEERIRVFPLRFQGGSGLIELPLTRAICVNLKFALKTSSSSGVVSVVYNSKEDFVGLEMLEAHLHVRYRYDSIRGQSAFEKTAVLNDTQWHDVQIQICTDGVFTLELELDGEKHTPTGLSRGRETVSTHPFEQLFLGGLPSETGDLRKHFLAAYGYDGCLADIGIFYASSKTTALNFQYPPTNPLRMAKNTRSVKLGCQLMPQRTSDATWGTKSASSQCRPGVCGFGGRCVQQLDTYFCDCTMSGFNGPVCTDVATAIKYTGGKAGCAVFEFSPLRNTSRDTIFFGIQTTQRSSATLLYITSHNKSLDFLGIELVAFKQVFVLRLIYNMGSGIKVLQESNVDISDGMFHVVRVIRNNAFMQLQVDSEDILESTSDGVNINGIFLADLLLGDVISGIFYKDGKNVLIDPTFTPKIRQISNLPANDMGAEQPYQSSSKPLAPLVIAKPNCYDSDSVFRNKLASCKPLNPNGIVVPKWNFPPPNEASSSLSFQGNSWSSHLSMTQHQQASSLEETVFVDNGGKVHPSGSDELFPSWSHERAPQDDAIRFNGGDNSQSLEELSEVEGVSNSGIAHYSPSLHTWLLLAGCVTAVILIALVIGFAVYKFRRRNEGSYNVEENRTFINQRSTSTLAPTPLLSTAIEPATELVPLQRRTPVEVESPNKEWYV
ncbi:hypothetical protein Aperf_G00000097705 [Anoplocephala perfoliata]